MYEGWASFAGVEIVNNERAAAYAHNFGIDLSACGCGNLAQALGDNPYLSPQQDNAPWYDPNTPESANFCGFFGLETNGFSRGTASRSPTAVVSGGAALGQLSHSQREMSWQVLAVAADDCALSYGLAWLADALRGNIDQGCAGENMCVFSCCPSCQSGQSGCGDSALRTLYRVGQLDRPELTKKQNLSGGAACMGGDGAAVIGYVTFSLVAGIPWIFRPPLEAVAPTNIIPSYQGSLQVHPLRTDNCPVPDTSCLTDPLCPTPPPAPEYRRPVDACYPHDNYDGDFYLLPVPGVNQQIELEKVPIVTLRSVDAVSRYVTLWWYPNPQNKPCTEVANYFSDTFDCDACAQMTLLYIPAGTTVTLDGRLSRAWADCPGSAALNIAEAVLYGKGGTTFDWPIFDCATNYCILIALKQGDHATDFEVGVSFVSREDMI